MPRYFCDYCQTYLTHDSAPGRKQHNRGGSRGRGPSFSAFPCLSMTVSSRAAPHLPTERCLINTDSPSHTSEALGSHAVSCR
jgi:hypothetical protein